MTNPAFLPIVAAPFERRVYIARLESLVDRYCSLRALAVAQGREASRLTLQLLMAHPSSLLELARAGALALEAREQRARAELGNLRAAAPIPAPVDRTDRSDMLALADLEWILRELRALRRLARRRNLEAAVASYLSAGRDDPLRCADPALAAAVLQTRPARLHAAVHALVSLRHVGADVAKYFEQASPELETRDLIPVGALADFRPGRPRRVNALGRTIAFVLHEGRVFALDDTCPHRGGPLGKGEVEDGALVCPLHGWAFDLATGKKTDGSRVCVATHETTVEDGQVFLVGRRTQPREP